MGGKVSSLLTSPSDVLPSYLKEEKLEFSLKLKVMESNPGYLLKSFLLYPIINYLDGQYTICKPYHL